MIEQQTKELITEAVRCWRKDLRIVNIRKIASDASPRRYYQVSLDRVFENKNSSIVAMIFDSLVSPDSGQTATVQANEACVSLTQFLRSYDYPVPELYFGEKNDQILLIEDLGEQLLYQTIIGPKASLFSKAQVFSYYCQAIDLIFKFQAIPVQPKFFPYQRSFDAQVYEKEMLEFSDYIIRPLTNDPTVKKILQQMYHNLALELEQLPRVLTHRDYHSWNLMLDKQGKIRVIDFQDALMATSCYDFVPLLNDRDTDSYLGEERYKRLFKYYWQNSKRGEDLFWEYDRVLLQRDLKVAGRFKKLYEVRKLDGYLQWIPGTLKRIGKTLKRINADKQSSSIYKQSQEILLSLVGEIKKGSEEQFSLID